MNFDFEISRVDRNYFKRAAFTAVIVIILYIGTPHAKSLLLHDFFAVLTKGKNSAKDFWDFLFCFP